MQKKIIVSLRELSFLFEQNGKFVLRNFISFEDIVMYFLNNDSITSKGLIWDHIEENPYITDDFPMFCDQIELTLDMFDEKLNMLVESIINVDLESLILKAIYLGNCDFLLVLK